MMTETASPHHGEALRDHAVAICEAASTLADAVRAAGDLGFKTQIEGLEHAAAGCSDRYELRVVVCDGDPDTCRNKGMSIRYRGDPA